MRIELIPSMEENGLDVKIIVATHKKYWMPDDEVYLPIHVGCAGKVELGYQGDNTGDNISIKNANYCELTGLYWAWKNLEDDYIGLCHYRRYFVRTRWRKAQNAILRKRDFEDILARVPVIVPKKRRYFIETNRSHYNHAHYAKDLDTVETVISELCPQYLPSFKRVMERTWAHMFNMFVMRRDLLDGYCRWLFHILSEVERRTDISHYDPVEARIYGYLSELLLDIWLETNSVPYKEVQVRFMERQNWVKKGGAFLKRQCLGHK